MAKHSAENNRTHARAWYTRQKAAAKGLAGVVYAIITEDNEVYVGATTNSLVKRLQQHRAKGSHSYIPKDAVLEILELEQVSFGNNLKEVEQLWMDIIKPSINKQAAIKRSLNKNSYKGGCMVNGEWFPTKIAAWALLGTCNYGTFKSRLSRGYTIEAALFKDKYSRTI